MKKKTVATLEQFSLTAKTFTGKELSFNCLEKMYKIYLERYNAPMTCSMLVLDNIYREANGMELL